METLARERAQQHDSPEPKSGCTPDVQWRTKAQTHRDASGQGGVSWPARGADSRHSMEEQARTHNNGTQPVAKATCNGAAFL